MSESSVKTKNKRQNDEKDEENDAVADSAKKVSIRQIVSLLVLIFLPKLTNCFDLTVQSLLSGRLPSLHLWLCCGHLCRLQLDHLQCHLWQNCGHLFTV